MSQTNQDAHEFIPYYEKHKKAIFNYILYRVGFDRAAAEDLTSEIFLKAFEHFDSYDRNRPFKTWIYAIAHNHLINYRSGRKTTLSLDDAIQVVRDESVSCEIYKGAVDREIIMSKILSLVLELPPLQQEIVIMRYVNDLNNDEIAQVLGKKKGAVRTTLSRAITALRNAYNLKFTNKYP